MDQRIFASFIVRNIELKFDKVERKLIAHFLHLPFHNHSQVDDFFYRLLILFFSSFQNIRIYACNLQTNDLHQSRLHALHHNQYEYIVVLSL